MHAQRFCTFFRLGIFLVLFALPALARAADEVTWPPVLRGANNGVLTLESPTLLEVPAMVKEAVEAGKAAPFIVAKSPPRVELTFHQQLGVDAVNRRLWSSWGDIALASDGRVYCAIGDHGKDKEGDARCFIYVWEPEKKQLRQIIDMNQVVPPRAGQPAWSKVHAKIDEGPDGRIYFCCTLNDGNRAKDPNYGFNDQLPGGQIYVYDPKTEKTAVFASLPPRRCTATSLFDRERGIWWCNLEAGDGNALWGMNLATKKVVYQGTDGHVAFNRAFTVLRDGQLLFNGEKGFARLDPKTGQVVESRIRLPDDSTGMRCASRETRDGFVYGVSHKTNQLFRYSPQSDELKMLGTNWLAGEYTTICELSPDDRFLYFLPGSHGKAWTYGTPIVQYELATGTRKVLAFLAPSIEKAGDYLPAGTYGMKISADGGTIFVNFNGHAADSIRPKQMKPIGFGLTSFAVVQIPASER